MKFSHIGIPTTDVKENESYSSRSKFYCTDYKASEYDVEFLRFEEGSPMPELLQTTAHVAFEVDDIEAAIEGKEILIPIFEPSAMPGTKLAFIIDNGAPVEFMQFS